MENLCNNCIHKDVCGRYAATWGMKSCEHFMDNGVAAPVRCGKCKYWTHIGDGIGDCTNGRFHLDGHPDPTMKLDEYCCLGERRA